MSDHVDNIVLITVDALRYDLISEDFEDLEMANIEELKNSGFEFERAFSNGTATVSAFPAILFSSKINDGSTPKSTSVAEAIREEGYQTIGLTSNPNTSSFYDYDRGFEIFKDYIEPPESKRQNPIFRIAKNFVSSLSPIYKLWRRHRSENNLPYERAEKLNEDFFEFYRENQKQFFWLHYMETHAPYSPPERYGLRYEPELYSSRGKLVNKLYDEEVNERERKALWNLYKAEAKYLDDRIGEILEYIRGKSGSSLIVFTSDHGEEFGERGGFQHRKL
ncbi:MAG: sulfatase-like hydrolase/transferase, partial [Candidatus Nanohaloarchaea archaeon]